MGNRLLRRLRLGINRSLCVKNSAPGKLLIFWYLLREFKSYAFESEETRTLKYGFSSIFLLNRVTLKPEFEIDSWKLGEVGRSEAKDM